MGIQIKENTILPDFNYCTPFKQNIKLSDVLATDTTCIIFLRYYGCTICQLDIMDFKREYEKIMACKSQIKIVLQSDPKLVSENITQDDLPFDIICDKDQELYKLFSINPAKNTLKMLDLKAIKKVQKTRKLKIKHGEYEGNELQLPAVFIVNKSRNVLYSHYGKSVGDVPSPDELVKIILEKATAKETY